MSVSLPSDKLLKMQQMAQYCYRDNLLHSMRFVLFGQDHLWCAWTRETLPVVFCHSEWYVEFLPFSRSFISSFYLSLPVWCQLLNCSIVQSLCNPISRCGSCYRCYNNLLGLLFQGPGIPYLVVDLGQIPCARLILPCKNSKLLHWGCVKWSSSYLVRWLSYILIIILLKLIYVIKVVQHLLFFL